MATTSRRLQSRQPSKAMKTASVTADQLANELATKLTIGTGKGKQRADEGDEKVLYMRSVNAASHALTQVVQAGWKKSSSDASKATLSSVNSSASVAAKGLLNLRKICPGDLDVERAASSILGKLIALEMFEPAETALSEMRPRICQLISVVPHGDSLLSIPEPSSPLSNSIILNLISTYLLHVLVVKTRPDKATSKSIEELASSLTSPTTRSLLHWFPNFASLPEKHTDYLLTRAYSTLTKLCSSFSTNPNKSEPKFKDQICSPEPLFTLRIYALRCLCHTSPGIIQAGTFWDQATSFSVALTKASSKSSEDRAARLVLDAYSEIASLAMKRSDHETFMGLDVKGFLTFCDYWTSFAKRAGDICLLQNISMLMRPHAPTSSPRPPAEDAPIKLALDTPLDAQSSQAVILEGTKCYNAFSQLTVLLEDSGKLKNVEALLSSLSNCTALLRTSTTLSFLLQPVTATNERRWKDEEAASRVCGKVDRAFEKMRRYSIKFIESELSAPASESSLSGVVILSRELLLECVAVLESLSTLPTLSGASMRDVLTRTLDTLFVLSRTGLTVKDPTTFVPAFEHLSRAARILDSILPDRFPSSSMEETVDFANYTRCVSGAFYNLAGSLYQASRYGNAVPFLIKSCELGGKALVLPRIQQPVPNEVREMEWAQLEEQLFRRWELLAVCYSKNGDRKNAHFAFKQAIHKFPFHSSGLLAQTDALATDLLFGASSSSAVKQLVGLIDRVTYIGACELFLPPENVSLLTAINGASSEAESHDATPTALNPAVAGALLERQLDTLEPSRWKDGVRAVFIQLLKDSLQIYSVSTSDVEKMPVRRARVLVRCMEFAYYDQGGNACSEIGCGSVKEMALQIEDLTSRQDLGRDTSLAHYLLQYKISARLWISLHTHRGADPLQYSIMSQQAEDTCRLMRQLLSQGSQRSPKVARKGVSPKAVTKSSNLPKVSKVGSPSRTRVTRQRVPAAPRKPVAVAKTRGVMKPVTPKSKTRTALQPVSFNITQTPPRRSVDGTQAAKPALIFDNFDQFFSLLQLVSRILGLLSLVLPKAHLLDMTRKLAQRQFGTNNDGYVTASLELAHEYVTLGKMKRAMTIFNQALEIVRRGEVSDEVRVRFLLRFAESLAVAEDVPKSSLVYLEALEKSRQLDLEERAQSTQQRIRARVKILEIAATAAHVFALVQHTKGDGCASLNGLLQSLRLWNRAVEALARLNPPTRNANSSIEPDPFKTSDLKETLPGNTPAQASATKKGASHRLPVDGMEWRILEGLLSTIFALTEAYYLRGSAREAEYFARQAVELVEELNVPAVHARALARRGEVQLHMNNLEDAWASISRAAELVCDSPGIDTAEIRRLKAEYIARTSEDEQEQGGDGAFEETVAMLEELDESFRQFDSLAFGPRRSFGASPGAKDNHEVLAPDLLASLLSHQLWLLRDDVGDGFNALLERFISLSHSSRSKAEQNLLMAKLTLHGVYGRFRADMFLSSLTESTIAVPMGMGNKTETRLPTLPSVEVLDALANAEKLLWAHVGIGATTGNVIKIRETAKSLVLIFAFRTSLGDRTTDGPTIMAALMDVAAALSLRRDMLEAIHHKFLPKQPTNDLQWPLLSADGTHLLQSPVATKFTLEADCDADEGDSVAKPEVIQNYWNTIRNKHQSQVLNPSALTSSEMVGLPDTWTIINISVTPDKGTLFISRQDGGVHANDPLVFCIPLQGRRDHGNGDDEEEHLTFEGAIKELQDIVRSSDECTKSAVNIKADDEEARVGWWKQRGELDLRMKQLLENIEYCWLGAFKAILSPRPDISPEATSELRGQFEKIFNRCLHVKEKKPKPKGKGSAHKKSISQAQTFTANQFSLDDCIVKCFSTLSPKCRDEELEDLVYFILDLYQFHGVPIAIAEVDIDQVVVDLRMMLEEYNAKMMKQTKSSRPKAVDEHLFLVLDKNVQGLPWESLPILRGRSISRVPGVQFLLDRLAFAKCKRESTGQPHDPRFGAAIDPRKGYYILNPSKDLGKTEERFRDWAQDMKRAGWGGVIGQAISEQQFINALETQDLVVYFGHGGGEQYARSHRIRSLPTCAATMLWGCSSGALREMGDFDRTGTPYNYMLAGCPTLVANLWDVTDKDIDKLSQSVLDKLHLTGTEINQLPEKCSRDPVSLVAAVAQSRNSCKLKYLTGAAPIVYGIPFYL